ncbi:MAG: helix-turn-helix transcriptional regulator [Bacteroidales bacterium]|nr:helix-turn-helix transcriptional regulator [Bacteroidales bacterium]
MIERIKKLILAEDLTPASFADTIGIQRSSISHILNGRNNPSLDFVRKTLQQFPTVNPDWLILGKGEVYRSTENPVNKVVKERTIFDAPPVEAPEPPQEKKSEHIIIQDVKDVKPERFVDKVFIFYSDHTWDEFKKA